MSSRDKLALTQEHIARVQAARDAVKPPALRKIAQRHFGCAKRLDCLRRELHVPEQIDLRYFAQPDFLLERIAILHLNHSSRLPNPESLRVQIQRPKIVSRRH